MSEGMKEGMNKEKKGKKETIKGISQKRKLRTTERKMKMNE